MLGLATGAELRLALYGVLLAAISSWLIYEHHHLISEGEATVKAQDEVARAAQKVEDAKVSAGVVNDLKSKLAAIPAATPPVVRLCPAPSRVRSAAAASGTQPSVATVSGTGAGGVPEGNAAIDIGPAVSDVARAAGTIAIYRDTTWEYAVKAAK